VVLAAEVRELLAVLRQRLA
jgi:hypothetical protein